MCSGVSRGSRRPCQSLPRRKIRSGRPPTRKNGSCWHGGSAGSLERGRREAGEGSHWPFRWPGLASGSARPRATKRGALISRWSRVVRCGVRSRGLRDQRTPQPTRVPHLHSGGWASHLNFGLLTSPRTQMRQRAQERPRESPVEKAQTSPVVSSNFNKGSTRGCRKGSSRIRRGGGSSGSSSPSWMERGSATLSAAASARGRAPDSYHSELVMSSRGLLRRRRRKRPPRRPGELPLGCRAVARARHLTERPALARSGLRARRGAPHWSRHCSPQGFGHRAMCTCISLGNLEFC